MPSRHPIVTATILLAACFPEVEFQPPSGGAIQDDTGGGDEGGDEGGDDTGDDGDDITVGQLELSVDAIDEGLVFVGDINTTPLTVTNVGEGAATAELHLDGAVPDAWALDVATGVLESGEALELNLTFAPTAYGALSASLWLTDIDSGQTGSIPLVSEVQEDGDGDGVGSIISGGDDCDDTDAYTYPGAEEVWYDGADQDCGEDDDYDQDGDGERAPEGGGDDCDDTNADVGPGAIDTWYDGVDTDCDGANDYDADGDGAQAEDYGGDDCNDNDADVGPGVEESWYDGVDSDCDGASDYDADGDGEDSDDHGGQDCDDTDPLVTGDDESLNGVDDDCSGQVDDLSVADAEAGVVYGYDTSMAVGSVGSFMVAEDVTDDGDLELVVTTDAIDYGYAWVVEVSDLTGVGADLDRVDTIYGEGYWNGYHPRHAVSVLGDVTGDGITELMFGTEGGSGGTADYGYVYAYNGGSSLAGTTLDLRDGDGGYWGNSANDDAGIATVADVDGDGVGDVVLGGRAEGNEKGRVAIFLGGSTVSDYLEWDDADDQINGVTNYDEFGTTITSGDLDADGYDDFIVSAPLDDDGGTDAGAVHLIMGTSSASWGGNADTADQAKITTTTAGEELGGDKLPVPGDVDGDGALDLMITDLDTGQAWLFLAAGSLGDTTTSSADHDFSGTAGDFASSAVIDSDLDNDGDDDVVLGAATSDLNGTDSGGVYFYLDDSAWGTSLGITDADAILWGDAGGDELGSGLAGGQDIDGDGIEDIFVGGTGVDDSASDGGAIYLIAGW